MNMKLIVTIFIISLTYQLAAHQTSDVVQRDSTGYSASIIHQNPEFPDQHAESSLDLHFGPNNLNQFGNQAKNIYEDLHPHAPLKQQPENYHLQFARTPKDDEPQEYPLQFVNNPIPQKSSSQSFNVGYSVKFGGAQSPVKQIKQPQPTLLNPDIITGSHKEEVIKPQNMNQIHEEYVLNSVLDSKKQRISGIKPKYYRPVTTNVDPAKLISQANLAPNTQMKLFELQGNKGPDYENDQYLKNANTSPWKTLSPGVEIYQSKPVQAVSKEISIDPNRFDHAKALGKSLKFDSSDILGFKPTDPQAVYNTQLNINLSPIKANGKSRNLYTTEKIQQHFEPTPKVVENAKPTTIKSNLYSDIPPYTQQNKKFSNNLANIPQQPTMDLLQHQYNTRTNNKNIEGSHDVPKYFNYASTVRTTPQHLNINVPQQTEQSHRNSEGNFYVARHQNEVKNFGNPQSSSLRSSNKPNAASALLSSIKDINAQLESNFNKQLVNIYKFTHQNTNPTFPRYGHNPKDYYNRYGHQVPATDLTKHAIVQQYISQPKNIARVSNPMYSVRENQTDNISQNPLYENNKVHDNNFASSYIPQKNFYRNNYGGTKKRRPISRYTKDVNKQSKPHSRNKGHVRMGPFL